MRGSAWLVPLAAMVLWLAAVGWPTAASVGGVIGQQPSGVEMRGGLHLLLVSSTWGLVAAFCAMVLGWLPGRWLGSAMSRRGFVPIAVLLLVPICLPAYVIFFAWWQAWPAGTWLYQWAVDNQQVQLVRHGTLLMGFICWSWPVVAWCVAGMAAATPAQREELLRLDGAGWLTRMIDRLRCDGRGLLVGGLIVFLATFNNTTSFDLAEVFTFGNELRAIEAIGANHRDVMTASLPATALTMIGTIAIWFLLGWRRDELPIRTSTVGYSTRVATVGLWVVSVGIPLWLLARNVRVGAGGRSFGEQWREFHTFYGQGLINTIIIALCCASLAVVIVVGLSWMWQDRRWWVRMLAHVQAIGWIVTAAIPGTMLGVSLRTAYNRPGLDEVIYTQPVVLVLGHLASFAFLGALFGRWLAMREPQAMRDLRALDGAERFLLLLQATWPRLLAAGAATFGVVFVLSLSEIPVTAAVRPAGFDAITTSILNDMHFQRPQTVMIATGIFFMLAIIAAGMVILGWRVVQQHARVAGTTMALALLCVMVVGCSGSLDADDTPPLRTTSTFGSPGRALGQFSYPRALAVDRERDFVFVVDTTARIQRFGIDGKPQLSWQMPDWELGKPTGLTVGEDGKLYVADTHYFRIMVFDAEGNEQFRFGRFGQEDGQFIYTTGVALGPEGRIYVSESGGNDRVQVFDSTGQYLFQFGSFGSERNQFNRPQSLMFNADKSELFIVDACNHRIVVTDPEGNVLRLLGEAGREAGQFSYPYDLTILPDGTLLVCEFHNCRVQRISPNGQPLGLYGRVGRREGELQYPWGVDHDGQNVFVLDSGNNRVQIMRTP